jgi:hypothetical protein
MANQPNNIMLCINDIKEAAASKLPTSATGRELAHGSLAVQILIQQ